MPFRPSLPNRLVQAIDGFGIERKPSGGHAQNTAIETGLDKLHGSLGEIRNQGSMCWRKHVSVRLKSAAAAALSPFSRFWIARNVSEDYTSIVLNGQ